MAVESKYWKEELQRIAKNIRPVSNPKRWSERAVCTVERDVMIGFFIVRRMIELEKVADRVATMKLEVFASPTVRHVSKTNRFSLEANYDWGAETTHRKSAKYLCNQCIHAYLSFVGRGDDRNWSDLLVVSDFDRNDVVWRIPFGEIISLFLAVAESWPTIQHWKYDPKIDDIKLVKSE